MVGSSICELVSSTPQSVPEAVQLEDTELDVSLSSCKKPPASKFNWIFAFHYTKLTACPSARVPQHTQIIWNRWTTVMPKTGHTAALTCSTDSLALA